MILKRDNVEREADDPRRIEELKKEGFVPVKIAAELPTEKPAEIVPQKPLKKMSKAELIEIAAKIGIENPNTFTKAELVTILGGSYD